MKKSMLVSAVAMAAALVAAGAAQADTLKKIKDSGVVTMGVRESSGALSYTLGDGKYVGFHVDVCTRALADIQKQLGLAKLETKYQPVTSQNRIPLVQNGTVDIECGSTTNNATRQKDVAFAVTTFVEEVRIAVKANSGITSIAQLNGKKVATTTGTTSVQTLRKNERQLRRGVRQGPRRQLPAARIGPCGRVRDGRRHPGRQHLARQEPGRLQDRRRGPVG
jgi:glutamate/aspartate transport system substrate-binding protein